MNILVCLQGEKYDDCIITAINCDLSEAKKYYINNCFNGLIAKFVLDIDKPFQMKVNGIDSDFTEYTFNKIDYNAQIDFRIVLNNLTDGTQTEVEPAWFFANKSRVIIQN